MGKLLKAVVSWAQHHAGITKPMLTCTSLPLPHVGGQLVHTLRDHLSRLQAQLQTDGTSIPHPLRVHDVATMDHMLTHTTHTDSELKLINSVRLRLNVYHLSEITSVDGTTIRNKPFMGIPDQCCKPNPMPLRQDKPSTKARKLWTAALTHSITTNR